LALSSGAWFLGIPPGAAHGPIDEQIAALTGQIQQDSQNAALYLRRGELHSHHRDWEGALADYDRAAQLDPNLAAVDLARGKTLLQAGRFDQAKTPLDRFLVTHPRHAEALASRARVLAKLGQRLPAAEDYARAIAAREGLGHPNPEYYVERARVLAAKGGEHVDAALRGLDEGLAKLGPLTTLQLEAIALELHRKRYDAALARLETIAAQSTRQELWLARRGEILVHAGRAAQARLAYEQALAAMESLPARHRRTRAVTELEAQIRAALARLAGAANKGTDP
jgi:tetratricopeptide (TPR) repeat protein